MSGLLASVRSVAEARIALQSYADIIDCKDPGHGALGALSVEEITRIVKRVAGERPVSATTGNLSGSVKQLRRAVTRTADCGVDLIKFGLFDAAFAPTLIRGMENMTVEHDLIAVCFADRFDPSPLLPLLADCGYRGVMIDTAHKGEGSLTDSWSTRQLEGFVKRARHLGLLCGLAGRLCLADIPLLLPLHADYLGFRGALCGGDRRRGLNTFATMGIRKAIPFQRNVTAIEKQVQVLH